jgi:hypothetical protein
MCCVVPATDCSEPESTNTNSQENNLQNYMTLGRYGGNGSPNVGIYDEQGTPRVSAPTATVLTVCEVDLL